MNLTTTAYKALKEAATNWYAPGIHKAQSGLFLLQRRGYVSFTQGCALPEHFEVTRRGYALIERLEKAARVERPIYVWLDMYQRSEHQEAA